MVKLIGSVIILFSASMVGWHMGRYYALRPLQLRTLLIALQMLETEIVYGATTLHKAFAKIGQRVSGEVGKIFLSAADLLVQDDAMSTHGCWQKAIERHWSQSAMRKEEKEVLLNLGLVLGSSDRGDQQKHLRLAMTHLRGVEEEARLEQGKYENMYKSLGFLGGLLVVILML